MARKNSNTAPALPTILVHLPTAIHCAIFNQVLLPEITVDGGRWFNVRTKDHHLPFIGSVAVVTPEGAEHGPQFVTKKLNYNFNDSTWFASKPDVMAKIIEIGTEVGGKPFTKKDALYFLEDTKNIFKASTFKAPAPAPVEEPAPSTEQVPEQQAA